MIESVPHLSPSRTSPDCRTCPARGRISLILTLFSSALIALLLLAPTINAEEQPEDSALRATRSSTTEEVASPEDSLEPLPSGEEAPERREFSLRPFYVQSETVDGSEKRVQFLWPIYLYKRSDQDFTVRLFPIFTCWRNVYAFEDAPEYSLYYMLFPFVYGGDSTEQGKYFALFPVAGVLKDFMGRDEIRFFLFPLYMEYTRGELHQKNYLWPILSFSDGDDYNGFRLWPLFGHFEKAGEYRNEFVLWPFYHHQTFNLDREQSGERSMLFPFYAREDSHRRRYRSVLWPFFSREENYAYDFEKHSVPWPFVVIARGKLHQTQFWPVYGYVKTEDAENRFLLWPFWRRQVFSLEDDVERHHTFLLPVLSSRTDVSESRGIVGRKIRVWPLWRFRRFEDGSTHLRMLSLLWFDDEEGAEWQYSPLWTIYERTVNANGTGRTQALWGLFREQQTPTRTEARIPLLFSRTEDIERDLEESKILGGLFGTSRTGDQRRLQLIYFVDIPY